MIDSHSFYNKNHLPNTLYEDETFKLWLQKTKKNGILYKKLQKYVKSLLYFDWKMWFNREILHINMECSACLKSDISQTYTKWQFQRLEYINNEYVV